MSKSDNRRAMLYSMFVNQNPSFKNYVITMGLYAQLFSQEEATQFCNRICGRRRSFAVNHYALAYTFTHSFNPN